ncbi:hypothetical protein MTR_4g097490 [Medicago truncatula]|uniref:Uncharacterized protein n=1 Tax=Medicago truncatula TaxID=3880 RepID=G7JF89_MEDTR|nr:hypothetical protein MTR_4g097490 [Medicago truncatula]
MSLCPEPSSPSSVYLPPLLDSSPYTAASIATFNGDQMCNSNNTDLKEHVSCFSTTSNVVAAHNNFSNNNNGSFDLVSPSMNATIDPFASLIPTEAKLASNYSVFVSGLAAEGLEGTVVGVSLSEFVSVRRRKLRSLAEDMAVV